MCVIASLELLYQVSQTTFCMLATLSKANIKLGNIVHTRHDDRERSMDTCEKSQWAVQKQKILSFSHFSPSKTGGEERKKIAVNFFQCLLFFPWRRWKVFLALSVSSSRNHPIFFVSLPIFKWTILSWVKIVWRKCRADEANFCVLCRWSFVRADTHCLHFLWISSVAVYQVLHYIHELYVYLLSSWPAACLMMPLMLHSG